MTPVSKLSYTKLFLKQLSLPYDAKTAKEYSRKWWASWRTKHIGGLRLTDEGYRVLVEEVKLKEYHVPFEQEIELSPQVLIMLDHHMNEPYYLTKNSITVFIERTRVELYLFSDDLRRYGLNKALKRNEDTPPPTTTVGLGYY